MGAPPSYRRPTPAAQTYTFHGCRVLSQRKPRSGRLFLIIWANHLLLGCEEASHSIWLASPEQRRRAWEAGDGLALGGGVFGVGFRVYSIPPRIKSLSKARFGQVFKIGTFQNAGFDWDTRWHFRPISINFHDVSIGFRWFFYAFSWIFMGFPLNLM